MFGLNTCKTNFHVLTLNCVYFDSHLAPDQRPPGEGLQQDDGLPLLPPLLPDLMASHLQKRHNSLSRVMTTNTTRQTGSGNKTKIIMDCKYSLQAGHNMTLDKLLPGHMTVWSHDRLSLLYLHRDNLTNSVSQFKLQTVLSPNTHCCTFAGCVCRTRRQLKCKQ